MGDAELDTPGVSARCVTCHALIEGDDRVDFERAYTSHQVDEHNRDANIYDAA